MLLIHPEATHHCAGAVLCMCFWGQAASVGGVWDGAFGHCWAEGSGGLLSLLSVPCFMMCRPRAAQLLFCGFNSTSGRFRGGAHCKHMAQRHNSSWLEVQGRRGGVPVEDSAACVWFSRHRYRCLARCVCTCDFAGSIPLVQPVFTLCTLH